MKLTKKEQRLVLKEIAKRMRDLVYFGADKVAEKILAYLLTKEIDARKTEEEIVFTYRMEFCIGDIVQIIGRERRQRGKK